VAFDLVAHAADRREQRVDRDIADRSVLGPVLLGRDIALAGIDRELDVDLGAVVEMADHQLGVQHLDVAGDLDVAGRHRARALLGEGEALGALTAHLQGDFLHVQHQVGDVLAHAGERGEFVQNAVDLDCRHCRALERRQQHATQGVAQGKAVAALQRLGDHRSHARIVAARNNFQLGRLDQFLPVPLDRHGIVLSKSRPTPAAPPQTQ
jgi:hypothetical protein